VPRAGNYTVATVEQAGPVAASQPTITVGQPPINPFGPPIVGAAVILTPFLIVALSLLLFWRR
jgi:hypothetical protein